MGLFAIAPDKEYGHYAAIRKVKKDFGGTRGEIVFSERNAIARPSVVCRL